MSIEAVVELTEAEYAVLTLMAKGWPRSAIAAHRGTAVSTINRQCKMIYAKLDVSSERGAVIQWWQFKTAALEEQITELRRRLRES